MRIKSACLCVGITVLGLVACAALPQSARPNSDLAKSPVPYVSATPAPTVASAAVQTTPLPLPAPTVIFTPGARCQVENIAPDAQNHGVITVSGEAEVRVVPDEVIITLGVETRDKNLDTAKRQNDEVVRKVLALTTQFGIPPEHVQTDYISIEPQYPSRDSYVSDAELAATAFFVRKTVVITLRDISKYEDLLTAVLKAGVTNLYGVDFRTTQLRTYRDQARALALRAAWEKAEAMAGELCQVIGEPKAIQEESLSWWSSYSWWGGRAGGSMTQNVVQEAGGAGAAPDTIAPGQITVSARVSASFDFR